MSILGYQRLRILIAGAGSAGQRHLKVLRELGLKNISVFDPQPRQIEKAKAIYPEIYVENSYEEGLEKHPDAVFIMTPPKMHIPMAIQAADRCCCIFCEKPLSDTLPEVGNLKKAIEDNGVKFAIGLCFRYHKGIQLVKDILESGKEGRIVSVNSFMGECLPSVRPDYKNLFSSRYYGAFDLVHDLDLALWLTEKDVRSVHCVYGNYSDIGTDAPDLAEILLDFGSSTAQVHLDFFHIPRMRYINVSCTDGSVYIDFSSWDNCTVEWYEPESRQLCSIKMNTRRNDMFRDEDDAFLKSILGIESTTYGIEDALASQKVISDIQNQVGANA